MPDNPLVSVLIGTFNRAHLLPHAVNSVLKQTYKNLEVIIVDDASTDNTSQVVQTFKDDRVKYLRHKENKGIAAVSNTAFSHCAGEYIALLGDDDWWSDHKKLEKQVKCFQRDRDNRKGIVGTWWQDIRDDQIIRKHTPKPPKDWAERLLVHNGIICGSMVMIRRSAWEAVGGFDERMKRGTDSELFRTIILQGYGVEIIPEIMGNVYVSASNRMTPSDSVEQMTLSINTIKYLLDKHQNDFDKYPRSKTRRFYQLAEFLLRKYRRQKDAGDLRASSSCLKKAMRCRIIIKPIIKWFMLRMGVMTR